MLTAYTRRPDRTTVNSAELSAVGRRHEEGKVEVGRAQLLYSGCCVTQCLPSSRDSLRGEGFEKSPSTLCRDAHDKHEGVAPSTFTSPSLTVFSTDLTWKIINIREMTYKGRVSRLRHAL